MTSRTKKWVIGIAVAALTVLVALSVVGYVLARRFEPYIRDQVVSYLHDRFDSDVELAALRVRMPRASLVETLFNAATVLWPALKAMVSCCATKAVEMYRRCSR